MYFLSFIVSFLLAAALLAPVPTGAAESYSSRPIRMIIPSGAGGTTDVLGRVIAPKLAEDLGQQVVIDNRPGASGIIGSHIVAKAAPDGYTLLMAFSSHPVNQSLFPNIPYDTITAFAPITLVSAVSPVLIVASQFPARSVKELIAIAKEKPGQLNYGSVGSGSMGHLGAELFSLMAGIRLQQVTYKGAPPTMTALLSGEIQLYLIGSAGMAVPQLKAGRLRALGVGARQRIAVMPEVPPIADALPGYEASGWNGILAPAGTPARVIDRLHRVIVKIVKSPEFSQVMTGEGAIAVGNTPAEFSDIIQTDVRKWAKIIKEAGIRGE